MTERVRCNIIFFNDTATTEIYTLSLHDALPIFLQVNRGINVLLHKALTHDNRVLKVIPFPSHVGNDWVLTKRHLAFFHRRTISNKITLFNNITYFNKGSLVVGSTRV